jgi:2-polyprenyl-6-methoxyphenol hydroxylase-like FAD-dependent oxidoreductase
LKVAIVGGGIGGLTAALALLGRGIDVDVYEQAAELREVGAGIQLSANGNRVFSCLGVLDEIRANACEAQGKEIRLWSTGQSWKLFDLGVESVQRYGFPYLTVYRPDLIAVLAETLKRAKPDAVHVDARCVSVGEGELRLAAGKRVKADVIVGADGVHSTVRQALFGADNVSFTGIIAWRGTVPMSELPAHMRRMVATNWVGPGGHVVHYPVRRGESMNFVGVKERSDWRIESWTALGDAHECAADYRGWHDDIHRMIRGSPQLYKWALVGRPPMERWTKGRTTLLGDACHPMLPFLASGAVMAIEDALVLARALAEIADVDEALRRYESARKERTTRAVLGSAENAKRFHDPRLANAAGAQEYVDREWSEERVRSRYEWLFTYDAAGAGV